MQIRIFNRQDDKALRALMAELDPSLDLNGKDNDLRNVEGTYFANGGLFLIAEEEGEILAFMGARRLNDSENLTVTRQGLKPGAQIDPAILEQLLAVVLNQAYQLDLKKVELATSPDQP